VLRRSRTLLQVGLDPDRRLLLPSSEAVRRTLDRLLSGDSPDLDAETREVLTTLAPLLVDAHGLVAPGVADGDVAAVALLDPAGYRARLAARRGTRVAVVGELPGADPRPLLHSAGLAVATADEEATVVLVLAAGEVDRDRLDPWLRTGTPHLLVRLVEGAAVIGPFVEPGRTACLRCLDAHAVEHDPHAAVLTAAHPHAAGQRRDGVAEPVDSALAAIALGWAVRDLVTHAEGERPSTWSTTVRLSPTLSAVTQAEWRRHPACGCAWLPDEQLSSTMVV
jgi:bacteriocin biosynthesis cyclodehydratase domain-containing protein